MSKSILIFIRNPELGKVKTRLAKSIGNFRALFVYERLLEQTRETVLKVDARRLLFYSETITELDSWNRKDFVKHVQVSGNLGDKMKKAFEKAFVKGSHKVIIIGSDCYDLSEEIITAAFNALDSSDAVIGPANDGGYYLLGMNSFTSEAFSDIKWSTSSVFEDTVAKFKRLDKTISILPELIDIDELSDLEASTFDQSLLQELNSTL